MYYKASLHMIVYYPNFQHSMVEDFDKPKELYNWLNFYRTYLKRNNVHADFDLMLEDEKEVIQLLGAI